MRYTNQTVFNKVWDTFIIKGTPRSARGNTCIYSSETNGVGCAIGCCIRNQKLKNRWDTMDNSKIHRVASIFTDEYNRYFALCNINLLSALQMWHDNSLNRNDLEVIGRQFSLKIPQNS